MISGGCSWARAMDALLIARRDELKAACLEARDLSYSPYSRFRVGAAVLYEDGTIVKGANFENASFSPGVCAERSALITGHMTGHAGKKVSAVAVSSDTPHLVSPCGVCRQFIRECATTDTPIFMYDCDGGLTERTLDQLLPLSFGPEHLL